MEVKRGSFKEVDLTLTLNVFDGGGDVFLLIFSFFFSFFFFFYLHARLVYHVTKYKTVYYTYTSLVFSTYS